MSIKSEPVQHGQKVLKTKVRVVGRFLIKPDEDFNAMVARQLIDKAKRRHIKVTTELRVFDTGIQLGDHGMFASMPIEFIRYQRLSDIIVLTNEPTNIVICVKDYDQRCVTIMRLNDSVSVKVVIDVVNRHRTAYMEEFAKASEFGSSINRAALASSHSKLRQGNGESRDYTDNGGGRPVQKAREPDYAVIHRRNPLPYKPATPPVPSTSSGGSFFTKITVPAGPHHRQNDWSASESQQGQSLHEQYQTRRSQLLSVKGTNGGTDDLEMAAIFETRDGPPTLLNEPIRNVAKVTDGQASSFDDDKRQGQRNSADDWRLAQRGHFYAGGSVGFRVEKH
ncbi:hypothetical protein BOX15_Mlig003318g1 [Macrostomum lignano]|uniref:Trematode PH-like domain-containing protein n=1 Tax=Macrostomum lignano TaxID=282301 RepID=A0A267H079_9PLAT|nr:hypothetical protein BOX15_Mlig003318g1 [Macrostomum lignano]